MTVSTGLAIMPSLTQAAKVSASRSTAKVPTVPAHMLPHRSPAELLAISRQGLAEAAETPADGLRYATAHLAALRAAAAVLAARARPEPRRRNRLTSVWALLATVAPELGEWAAFFAAGASKRAAAEAGIPRAVTAREADDLIRASEQFVEVVAVSLGLAYQPALEGLGRDRAEHHDAAPLRHPSALIRRAMVDGRPRAAGRRSRIWRADAGARLERRIWRWRGWPRCGRPDWCGAPASRSTRPSSGRCRWLRRCVRCFPAGACAGAAPSRSRAVRRRVDLAAVRAARRGIRGRVRGVRWWACPGSGWSRPPRPGWPWNGSRSCPHPGPDWAERGGGAARRSRHRGGRHARGGPGAGGEPAHRPGPAAGGGARVGGPVARRRHHPRGRPTPPGTAWVRDGDVCAAGRWRWSRMAGAPPPGLAAPTSGCPTAGTGPRWPAPSSATAAWSRATLAHHRRSVDQGCAGDPLTRVDQSRRG